MNRSLSPCPAEVQVERLLAPKDHIIIVLHAVRASVPCPECGQPCHRVHSYYERRLSDLPWNGIPVKIRLRTRRFFCDGTNCAGWIFAERLPGTSGTYSRRTQRMQETLCWLALALGGEAGARTAQRLGMIVSGDTLLRHLRRMGRAQHSVAISPRVLGIDDWAWRKGQRYGTVLCDLERRRVIDLLPDRRAQTVAEWLRSHAPPQIISRDRAGAYAEAASRGAPGAVQVADRFHLLRNLREALEHILARHTPTIEQAFQQLPPSSSPAPARSDCFLTDLKPARTPGQQLSQQRRQQRLIRYQRVVELHQEGVPKRAIASQVGLHPRTVRRWLCAGQFPERQVVRKCSSVDQWLPYLQQRWDEGCHNRSQLWRELRAKGANFAVQTLDHFFRMRLGIRGRSSQRSLSLPRRLPSPRQTSALLLGLVRHTTAHQQSFVKSLCALSPEIAQSVNVAHEFQRMLRKRDVSAWPTWHKAAGRSLLRRFAAELTRDEAAVRAAITLPWSTGPVEGHINRLKLIKRQMYGRAKLDLLRIRILYAV
jgi:transposase